jgi:D-serine deaminase-like pyridoxal phosphate-dependent protein
MDSLSPNIEHSSPHYFKKIAQCLREEHIAQPTLIIDKQAFDHNLTLLSALSKGLKFRLVAKSLPSLALIDYVQGFMNSRQIMSFHLPFIKLICQSLPQADVLVGKPMTAIGVEQFYRWYETQTIAFQPAQQLQWLVDSLDRLKAYEAIAKNTTQPLQINLEIDVGLHRGGITCLEEFEQCLLFLQRSEHLSFSGLMGYEAHIYKVPSFLGGPNKAAEKTAARYAQFLEVMEFIVGSRDRYCINTGGSTTFNLYQGRGLANEIACGSLLLKPSDFDLDVLREFKPALFIATPILKTITKPELPGVEKISPLLRTLGVLPQRACFIYGGNWMARPIYPRHSKLFNAFGHSSNQEMYTLPNKPIDDETYLFMRPTQSEALMLGFGDIAIYEHGKIIDWWPVFNAS